MKKLLFLFLSEILIFSISFAQESVINITSNVDGVLIFIDTLYIGRTPVKNYIIKPGDYTLKGIRNDVSIWDKEISKTQLLIKPHDSVTISLNFRNILKVVTEPENARILLNDIFVGYSPLTVLYKNDDTLKIGKNNYESEIIPLYDVKDEILKVKLRPKYILIEKQGVHVNDDMKVKNVEHNKTFYYLLGGGLAFGTFAVISKNKADKYEADYNNNPSEDLKRSIRLFDTLSNISLAIFEACFFTLSYLLIRD
jgi:hypothetical protein